MRPQTHHQVRLDVTVEHLPGFFVDVNALKGHVKMEEWVGPNGDSAVVHVRQTFIRGMLNADQHFDVALAFKLTNYMTDKSRIITLKGALLLLCNNTRYVLQNPFTTVDAPTD
jgi:hypothetical protein